jgi:L-cysteine:1D-myo-inositol 2-amino-2-deoxy-alpha-D-glucopyranoside ligase
VSRPTGPPADATLDGLRRHLADDLDAPGALTVMDRWVAEAERRDGTDEAAPGVVSRAVNALLGIRL